LTLQETEVLEELETVAENESASPRSTLPEAGEMVTVICDGGGGVLKPPPPPPPQAVRSTLIARAESADVKQRRFGAR
jgi:hypothetical protein